MLVIVVKQQRNINGEQSDHEAGGRTRADTQRNCDERKLIICRGLAAHRASARPNKAPSPHDSDINA